MDRRTILERLDVVRAGSQDLDLPEMEEVSLALARDSSLNEELQQRGALDRMLAAAMHDVPVPPELKSRILTRLAKPEQAVTPSPSTRPRSRRHWIAVAASFAACILLVVGLWATRPTESEPLTVTQLQSSAAVLLQTADNTPAFDGNFDPQLPSNAWLRLRMSKQPIGLLLDDGKHRAAAWTFTFGNSRGVLVAVPVSEVASPPASDLEYRGGNAIAWTANGFVYVCQVDGSIDHLRRQLDEGQLA